MEKSANLHRDLGGGSTIPGEMSDIKSIEVVKGSVVSCKNSEPSDLSTVAVSCGGSSTLNAGTASDQSHVQKSHVKLEMYESLSLQKTNAQPCCMSEKISEAKDQLTNGMEHSLPLDVEGATSKLVNKTDGGPPAMEAASPRISDVQTGGLNCESQGQTTMLSTMHFCPDKTNVSTIKLEGLISNDQIVSEGPLSGSDPSPAIDSRSFDSLESFSNLNSCPSSDLNSEGTEDRVLAIALQSDEYGADGPKVPFIKDRNAGQSIYHIKWIKWKEENTPIITQNENGPCPLLAIMNVLLLAWKVKMPPMMEIITAEQLMEYLVSAAGRNPTTTERRASFREHLQRPSLPILTVSTAQATQRRTGGSVRTFPECTASLPEPQSLQRSLLAERKQRETPVNLNPAYPGQWKALSQLTNPAPYSWLQLASDNLGSNRSVP